MVKLSLLISLSLWCFFLFPFFVIAVLVEVGIALALFFGCFILLSIYCLFFRGASVKVFYQGNESNQRLVDRCPTLKRIYKPTIWGESGHLQSIILGLVRPGPPLPYERELVRHLDGSTVAVDWLCHPPSSLTRPMVAIMPGITGGGFTPYVRWFAKFCYAEGWNVVVMNHRGCGGHELSTPQWFQMGNPLDVKLTIDAARARYPSSPIIGVGFSLGANLLVNYVCRVKPSENQLTGAISICQGYDGDAGVDYLTENQPFYSWVLTKKITGLLQQHRHKFESLPQVNIHRALSATKLKEFETHFSCPLLGYESPEEYYLDQSCRWHIKNTPIPLLLINALDDPLVPNHLMPWTTWQENEKVIVALTKHGGHLGFAEGFMTPNARSWTDHICIEFIRALLERKEEEKGEAREGEGEGVRKRRQGKEAEEDDKIPELIASPSPIPAY